MVAWHRSRRADLGLRISGLLFWAISYLAISRLVALRLPPPEQAIGGIAFILTAVGFLSASAGTAMVVLGRHLFDQVEISARWRRGSLASTSANRPPRITEEPRSDFDRDGLDDARVAQTA